MLLQVPIHDVIGNIPQVDLTEIQQQLNFQQWMKNIGVFEMVVKGLLIGIFVSAPMGPVGVLCVQRTLKKGRWHGFATGVGAALSDIIYALITGIGVSFIVDIIEDPIVAYWSKIVGAIVLFFFGWYTFRSNPVVKVKTTPQTKKEKGKSLTQDLITGFLITFANPGIILVYVSLFGTFTFVLKDNSLPMFMGSVSIVIGALSWWFLLTTMVDKVRRTNNMKIIWSLNRVIGSAVILASILMLVSALSGHSFPMLEN